jgi:EpsD family peptidyl-prolyl cis-trans isomerase
MNRYVILNIGCVLGIVLLGGCQKEATGQVAAVVNGDEITLQEVNAELAQMQLPEGVNKTEAQKAALKRIVDRRLLAQAARDDGMDKTPEFLIRSRQLQDALLVQLLGQRIGRSTAVPDSGAVDAFIRKNPAVFSGRTMYTIDRIQFPVPAHVENLKALEQDHSMDAVAARLRQMGIQFTRGPAQMDSAQLGQERLDRIHALAPDEPFVLPEGGIITIAEITGSEAKPVENDQARPVAVQIMRNQSLSAAMRQRLDGEEAKADIKYQQGFSPPAPASSDAAPSKSVASNP